jgi:hypothetical protein
MIDLPEIAAPEEVLRTALEKLGFDSGKVRQYKPLETRRVNIRGSLPNSYTAMLVDTDLGQKVVLIKYAGPTVGWWSRVYDANRTYYRK